jgi:tetratricopeptide (TPR) repeat protein
MAAVPLVLVLVLALLLALFSLSYALSNADKGEILNIQEVYALETYLHSLLQQGQSKAALNVLSTVSSDLKSYPSIQLSHARAYAQLGKYPESQNLLESVLALKLDNATIVSNAHLMLGKIHLQTRYYLQAEEHLQQALTIDPDCIEAYIFLSKVHLNSHSNINTALEYIETAYQKQPKHALLLFEYGMLLLYKGDTSRAREMFHTAKSLNSKLDLKLLGKVYLHYNLYNYAKEEFEEILRLQSQLRIDHLLVSLREKKLTGM